LIVEDETDIGQCLLDQVAAVCKKRGLTIRLAVSYTDAQREVQSLGASIRAAVVDLALRVRSGSARTIDTEAGIRFCKMLHKEGLTFPIVVHTFRTEPMCVDACRELGSVAFYVCRPWMSRTLVTALERCLEGVLPAEMQFVEYGGKLE